MEKVAIIDPLGAHGSSHHFYLYGQLRGLHNNSINVRLYTNSQTKDPGYKGIIFYKTFGNLFASEYKLIRGGRYILGSFRSLFHAKFSGCGIFHFHVFDIGLLMLFNLLVVKILFGKVVLTVHDVASFAKKSHSNYLSNLVYNMTGIILTHNQFSKDEIIKLHPFLEKKIHLVPHGNYLPFINIQKDKQKARKYLGLPSEKSIILFFGMIKKVKGLDLLLQSFRKVVEMHPNTILLIAGKTWEDDFAFYQKIIDKYQLAENIILHKRFISHNDVEYYYGASDLVVLPYKRIYQSGVLMMALSYGRPALVSDLLPFKEIIIDDENGFLFKTEDITSLAEKLKIVLSNKQNLERVQNNGQALVKAQFDWDKIGQLTKKAYQSL